MMMSMRRRDVLRGAGVGLAASWLPAWAAPVSPGLPTLSGSDITLRVAHTMLRLRGGQDVRLTVINDLPDEDTSIHWHGLLVPFQMDGVPGVSFPGIKAGARF